MIVEKIKYVFYFQQFKARQWVQHQVGTMIYLKMFI